MGYVKQIPRCPEKSLNVTNCTRILLSRSDRRTDHKTLRNWKSRILSAAVATSRSNTSKWNEEITKLRRNVSAGLSWSSRKDWSADPKFDHPIRLLKRIIEKAYWVRNFFCLPERRIFSNWKPGGQPAKFAHAYYVHPLKRSTLLAFRWRNFLATAISMHK